MKVRVYFLHFTPVSPLKTPDCLLRKRYLCTCHMSKLRKIALIGIGVVIIATIGFKIAGIYPGIVAVHALPFCMMLILDMTRKKEKKDDQPKS